MKRLLLAIAIVFAALPAFAWGEKGHYLVNESATVGLPNDMPSFFYKAFPELIYLAYDPDRWKGGGVSLDAANEPNHFLNYENTEGLELPRDRYAFVQLMIESGRVRQLGITASTTGFLPWRIAELTEQLTTEFRIWRNTRDPRERELVERDIIHVAGTLGHFAGDSSNPHHATIKFNGWVGDNPNGYAIDCDVHARFEREYISHAVEIGDVTPKLAAPKLRTDYFNAALEAIRDSNALVEPLYKLDRAGGFDLFKPISSDARSFAAARVAAGGSLLRDLWWSAWRNSGEARRRRG
jgi:hypothetical protein